MTTYIAPIADIEFTLFELLDYEGHLRALDLQEIAPKDIVRAIISENAKFCQDVLAPLNRSGDIEGCAIEDGVVATPAGFKEAYQQYVEAGWPSMVHPEAHGGQGLPESLGTVLNEIIGSANWAWSMYPGLSHGAMKTLSLHGTDEQKQTFLTKLVSGEWTGTMCLTEPQCGTDLGLLKTKAEPMENGAYKITGTKIFISAGEHDLSENIVHIVLARLPDAPEGTGGISLFIVPKLLPDGLQKNNVNCGSLEHKMGIHGNATCVMNFDGATAWMVGQPNKGLHSMFTFMNIARLGTAMQGVGHAEFAYQKSLAYSKERLQGRVLSGPSHPEQRADPIAMHMDVRRMILTQKAIVEGGRMLTYYIAQFVDIEAVGKTEQERQYASDMMALLTPIAKAFLTELGFEAANLGLQCFGGHGYIAEWGMEQNVRDARISTLYEGTTGVQALDLLGRKVLMTQGELLKNFTKVIHLFCQEHKSDEKMQEFVEPLSQLNKEWGELTMGIGAAAMKNPDEVSAACVDYLMYCGYVSLAYFWARAAQVAMQRSAGGGDADALTTSEFYSAKLKTAQFYYARILPRTESLKRSALAGAQTMAAFSLDEL